MGQLIQSENNSRSFSPLFRSIPANGIGAIVVLVWTILFNLSFTHADSKRNTDRIATTLSTEGTMPEDNWSLDCGSDKMVEIVGKGIRNALPTRLDIDNPTNIDQIVVEIIYKEGNPGNGVEIKDATGNTYAATRHTPAEESTDLLVYR
ncbi:MAG: hypothetical protein AAGK47_10625, partial [Bacteroidota bacterium]